jgi:hypothetical protein
VTSLQSDNASHNALGFHFTKFSHGHVIDSTHSVSEGFDAGKGSGGFNGPAPHADITFF